jgi:hypothetical protein
MSRLVDKLPIKNEERSDVVLLALVDVILQGLTLKAKPNSARHNRLRAMSLSLKRVDETYQGYMPKDYLDKAETILDEVSRKVELFVLDEEVKS